MQYILFLIALIAGATAPIQAGINSQLEAIWAKNSILAATVSFMVGTIGLIAYCLITRMPIGPLTNTGTSWWHWIGGLLGIVFVVSVTYLAPRLGAVTMVGLVITGQMLASVILDHFGLLGYPVKPVSLMRVMGIVMMFGGIMLVRKY